VKSDSAFQRMRGRPRRVNLLDFTSPAAPLGTNDTGALL